MRPIPAADAELAVPATDAGVAALSRGIWELGPTAGATLDATLVAAVVTADVTGAADVVVAGVVIAGTDEVTTPAGAATGALLVTTGTGERAVWVEDTGATILLMPAGEAEGTASLTACTAGILGRAAVVGLAGIADVTTFGAVAVTAGFWTEDELPGSAAGRAAADVTDVIVRSEPAFSPAAASTREAGDVGEVTSLARLDESAGAPCIAVPAPAFVTAVETVRTVCAVTSFAMAVAGEEAREIGGAACARVPPIELESGNARATLCEIGVVTCVKTGVREETSEGAVAEGPLRAGRGVATENRSPTAVVAWEAARATAVVNGGTSAGTA